MHYLYWIRKPEHTDILTQGYIGHSANFDSRMRSHKSNSKRDKSRLYNAIRGYGWDNLIKEIILIGPNQEYCANVEFKLRPKENVGWNHQPGGSFSPSIIPEIAAKISEAMKGKKQTDEHIRNRVSKNTGQKRSEEQKLNISKALKEADGTKQKYLVTFPDGHTEIVFGMKPWCASNNVNASYMFKLSTGKIDYYRGFSCKKVTISCEQKLL